MVVYRICFEIYVRHRKKLDFEFFSKDIVTCCLISLSLILGGTIYIKASITKRLPQE